MMVHAPDERLGRVLQGFLDEIGVERGDVVLGRTSPAEAPTGPGGVSSPPRRRPSAAQREELLKRLEAVSGRARPVLWLWAIATIVVLLLAVGLAIYHRENTTFVGMSMLGGSGALVAILAQVRAIHSRLVATEVLLVMLPNLPPEEWVRIVMTLLEEFKDAKASRPAAPRRTAA